MFCRLQAGNQSFTWRIFQCEGFIEWNQGQNRPSRPEIDQ